MEFTFDICVGSLINVYSRKDAVLMGYLVYVGLYDK